MVYIGTYNSGAAKLSIPILNAACIVMISPANTYPGLTKEVAGVTQPGEPDTYYPNGYRNYARPIATDDVQGAAGAEWAKTQGKTKAYVLDDTQLYGAGLAKAWAQHANKIGLEVVSPNKTSEGFDAKATDYSALAQKIKASGADIIYIGSITGQNTGKLWKDLRAGLPDIMIMSGDGVFEKSWYDGAGTSANGTFLTFGGLGPDQLTGAGKEWFDKYKTDHNGDQPATYTAYGNAAATTALAALQKAGTERPVRSPQGRHGHQGPADRPRQPHLRRQRRRHRWLDQRLQGRDQLAARVPADPHRQGIANPGSRNIIKAGHHGPP